MVRRPPPCLLRCNLVDRRDQVVLPNPWDWRASVCTRVLARWTYRPSGDAPRIESDVQFHAASPKERTRIAVGAALTISTRYAVVAKVGDWVATQSPTLVAVA